MYESPASTRRVDQSLLTIVTAYITGGSAVVLRLLLRLLLTTASRPTGARRPYVRSTETTRVVGALVRQRVGCAIAHTGYWVEPPGGFRIEGRFLVGRCVGTISPSARWNWQEDTNLMPMGARWGAISCKKYLRVLPTGTGSPAADRPPPHPTPRRHGRLPAARQQQRQTS